MYENTPDNNPAEESSQQPQQQGPLYEQQGVPPQRGPSSHINRSKQTEAPSEPTQAPFSPVSPDPEPQLPFGTANAPYNQPTETLPHYGGQQPSGGQTQSQPVTFSTPQRPASRSKAGLLGLVVLMLGLLGLGVFIGWQMHGTNAAPPRLGFIAATPTITSDSVEQTRETVIERFKSAVVQINVVTDQGTSLGSGVIIDDRGYIITNNHVVANSKSIQVVLANGNKQNASLTGTSALDDLAVIKIDPTKSKLTVAQLGDSSSLRVGQNVLVIGNPLGITQTVTSGIISALDRNVVDDKGQSMPGAIQTDAPINPGNSGGALIDLQAKLVGIPTSVPIDPEFKTPASGVGFAIPVNRVKFIAPQLIESGHVTNTGRAVLGIDATSVDPVLAQQNSLPVDHGVLIANVTPGGPAEKAGLKAGDVIVKVDNTDTDDTPSLADVLLSKKPGDTVNVQYYRNGQQSSVDVKLGERTAS